MEGDWSARRKPCMVGAEAVMVGQAGARMEVGAVATAAGQSAVVAQSEAVGALLGDVEAQVAAGPMRVRPGAVGSLGAAGAETGVEEGEGVVAADTGRSGEDGPAVHVPGSGGEAARAAAGSTSGVVVLQCLAAERAAEQC